MQEAGRILLMPKGDYAAGTTYTMLDLVNHSGASWVCKKDCTGQEPSDSNTEFWQRFGTAVDLSNYFPKSGGTIDGDTVVKGYKIALENPAKSVGIRVYDNGTAELYDYKNAKNILRNTADGTNTFNGTASGNLPLTGGRISANSTVPLELQATNSTDTLVIPLYNSNGEAIGTLGFRQGKPIFRVGSSAWYEALHTGNKPTGTYTGNGSATARQINVGGTGIVIYLRSAAGADFIVGYHGAFGVAIDGTPLHFSDDEIYFRGGVINVSSTNNYLNGSGVVNTYNLL